VELNLHVYTLPISADISAVHRVEALISSVPGTLILGFPSIPLLSFHPKSKVMSQVAPPLSQGVGYGIVIGVGLAFAAGKVVNL
jgi:hypothetical protein